MATPATVLVDCTLRFYDLVATFASAAQSLRLRAAALAVVRGVDQDTHLVGI